jgi:hypothetical protein
MSLTELMEMSNMYNEDIYQTKIKMKNLNADVYNDILTLTNMNIKGHNLGNVKKTKHDKFINGLIKLGYDSYDIINNWIFLCDNGKKFEKKKWDCITNGAKIPKYSNNCICGHYIKKQCYISNREKNKFLIVGSCCRKQFMSCDSLSICLNCALEPREKKCDYCFDCKLIMCSCGKKKKMGYKLCYQCNFEK